MGAPGSVQLADLPRTPFTGGYREHLSVMVGTGLFCLRCGCLPRDQRKGFSTQLDGACGAQLGAVPSRVITGLSTFTLQHPACQAGFPHWELWRALVEHCGAVAQGRGSDALPVIGVYHGRMGWGSLAYPSGMRGDALDTADDGQLVGFPGCQGQTLTAPGGAGKYG